jgi:hypothetical protein
MRIFDSLKHGMSEVKKDERTIQKLEKYADLNKDGNLDSKDMDKARQYEASAKSVADKLRKK